VEGRDRGREDSEDLNDIISPAASMKALSRLRSAEGAPQISPSSPRKRGPSFANT
jgi:hypothetical protein